VSTRRNRDTPSIDAGEWVGGQLAAPAYVTAGEPYRVEVVLWLELPDAVVVGTEVVDPRAPVSVTQMLVRTMAQPLVGPPRRPARIRVADAALAVEVRAVVPDMDVIVAPTPELHAVLAEMAAAMPASDERESYLEAGRVPADVVAILFRAAEMLYRLAPWKTASDDQVLCVDIPALGVHGACLSIIGGLGESLGFVLFPSLAGYEAFVDTADASRHEELDFGTTALSLTFERGADVAPSRRREVAAHGWPVAGPQAYPRVEHRDRDGLPRPLTEQDVRVVAACAQALGIFSLRHPRVFVQEPVEPVCETYTDEADLAVRVTIPYEAYETFELEEPPFEPSRRAAPKVARNAPCPCGSGKKYKKCCLRAGEATAAAAQPAPIHTIDERLVLDMMRYGDRRFGNVVSRAAKDFRDPDTTLQLFCPWAVYGLHVEGRPIVAWYLAERGRQLPTSARDWLASQQRAWLSVWEVLAVEPGTGITVRDLLSGEERQVHEVSGSRTLVRRDAVLARMVEHAGEAVFCGSHPRPLPPGAAASVVRRIRTTLRTKGPVAVERLRDDTIGRRLIARWEEAVAELDRARAVPPQLHNTDGDPLLLTIDHFVFAPADRADVEACLGGMEHVQLSEADEPEPHFTFVRPGNVMHKSWDTTVIGRAVVADGTLKLETNSVRRADTLRQRIETACGGRLRHRAREHVDPTSPRVQAAHRGVPVPLESPEATELLRAYKERHYVGWIDQPLPVLRGQTPREAVRTKTGRERVDVLLKELENHESRLAEGAQFDFARLRAALSLKQ
jgi:SEC-C motif